MIVVNDAAVDELTTSFRDVIEASEADPLDAIAALVAAINDLAHETADVEETLDWAASRLE